MKPSQLSDNELAELICMGQELKDVLEKYAHLKELIPKSIAGNTSDYYDRLCEEYQSRNNSLNNLK